MIDVAIVGAGPVGLLFALRLHSLGVSFRVLERDAEPREGSRSIGVHPPSLERLDQLGLASALIARGVCVRAGRAFVGGRELGRLELGEAGGAFPFVLAVPQTQTEQLLRSALVDRAPRALVSGAEVDAVHVGEDAVRVRSGDGAFSARFVVACDGRRSACRERAGIAFRGAPYPGRYLMADARDTTELGEDAAIFLHPAGLVESFPLPNGQRRWVARRREAAIDEGGPEELLAIVRARTGQRVDMSAVVDGSGFVAERYLADTFQRGRLLLCGDAAHVVSPIGGQGMNLGWLGAWSLAEPLAHCVREGRVTRALEREAARHRRRARTVARRAELNMWLGRPTGSPLRGELIKALLHPPQSSVIARAFTMRGLALGV